MHPDHFSRRQQLLERYPEMETLQGPDQRTFPFVLFLITIHLVVAQFVSSLSFIWQVIIGYMVGGTITHMLQLAIHDLSHNLCFHNILWNKLLGMFCNMVTLIPSSETFKRYHMDHHARLAVDGIDLDLPSMAEILWVGNSSVRKALWLMAQPLVYSLRPLIIRPLPLSSWEILNGLVAIFANIMVYRYGGVCIWLYLFGSTLSGMSLHPAAIHIIAEHYCPPHHPPQVTYSYYGPMNWFNLNVGYHVEHHDFPRVAWWQLPKIRKIAQPYYDELYFHTSYVNLAWTFVFDKHVSLAARLRQYCK